jgi:nucleotide-binding universal stress UspA family protein
MRRVVIPASGEDEVLAVLPDAQRLAGAAGVLVLVHIDALLPLSGPPASRDEIEMLAERLRSEGLHVDVLSVSPMQDGGWARFASVGDIIACALPRSSTGRIPRGCPAWSALVHGTAPVLLRHVGQGAVHHRAGRIMVPLDGSSRAEQALPLATDLAYDLGAALWLVHVVPAIALLDPALPAGLRSSAAGLYDQSPQIREAESYISGLAARLPGLVHTEVVTGRVSTELIGAAERCAATHVVMASHGRTALPRAILGGITDELIQRLQVPVVVVPTQAAMPRRRVPALSTA